VSCSVSLRVMLARFACADAALARLVLGFGGLCLLSGSCRCFLFVRCMLCEQIKDTGMNAPPTRLPNLVPFALT
jgi:hypothetical protein